ncbi:GNAT family N-acetyltransferase [Maribacter dokdonensis]|uniref:GNAT family N-acetyltransferase n=1 Tax=Maribacter dokdonensis TaxID=320912 RepID=UPI001C09FA1E|nr:GNAT family N-acetyltransferase [Maribacter dokdonensis]MBU2902931.1 GNAT family N-acetyltransferase [Maribacter dokdonensis]
MITNYTDLNNNFIQELEQFTENEMFKLYYLYVEINRVNTGNSRLLKAFTINDGLCKVIGLITDNAFYLYAKDWNKKHLELVSKIANLKSCPEGFEFFGTNSFINELFKFDGYQLNVIKNRFLYKIDKPDYTEFDNNATIEKPLVDNTIEITHLYQEYYVEEYSGKVLKEFNDTKEKVIDLIKGNSILVIKVDGIIVGFRTIMFKGTDLQMIGTIFIDLEQRNKKLGKSLASYVTKDLLISSNSVFLMTTKENIPSNKMFESIGYNKIYEQTNGRITVGNTV